MTCGAVPLIQQQMLAYYLRCVFDKNKVSQLGVCVSSAHEGDDTQTFSSSSRSNPGVSEKYWSLYKCKILIYVAHWFSSSRPLKECFIQDLSLVIRLVAVSSAIVSCSPKLYSTLITLFILIPHLWLLCAFKVCLPYFAAVWWNPVVLLAFWRPKIAQSFHSGMFFNTATVSVCLQCGSLKEMLKVEVAAVAYYRNNHFLFHQCQISNNSPLYFPPQPNLIQTVLLWDPPQAGWQGLGSRGGWGKWTPSTSWELTSSMPNLFSLPRSFSFFIFILLTLAV